MRHASKSRFKVAPKSERTVYGIVFASKRECKRFVELKNLEIAGEIDGLKCQPKFPVFIDGKEFCMYRADFSYLETKTRNFVIEDVKSTGTAKDPAYRLRKKAAELFHGIKITELTR